MKVLSSTILALAHYHFPVAGLFSHPKVVNDLAKKSLPLVQQTKVLIPGSTFCELI